MQTNPNPNQKSIPNQYFLKWEEYAPDNSPSSFGAFAWHDKEEEHPSEEAARLAGINLVVERQSKAAQGRGGANLEGAVRNVRPVEITRMEENLGEIKFDAILSSVLKPNRVYSGFDVGSPTPTPTPPPAALGDLNPFYKATPTTPMDLNDDIPF